MGEIAKHVIEHFPVDKLPPELRQGLESGKYVRITVEEASSPMVESAPRRLTDLIGAGKGVYGSPEEALAGIRALRDEWE